MMTARLLLLDSANTLWNTCISNKWILLIWLSISRKFYYACNEMFTILCCLDRCQWFFFCLFMTTDRYFYQQKFKNYDAHKRETGWIKPALILHNTWIHWCIFAQVNSGRPVLMHRQNISSVSVSSWNFQPVRSFFFHISLII